MKNYRYFSFSARAIWVSLWDRFDGRRTLGPWRYGMSLAGLWLGICIALPAGAEKLHIDLNHAGVTELCRLPGIGPKRAEAIVEMRRKKPFTRISQLLRVRGIGRKTLSRLRPLLYIDALGQIQRASSHPLRSTSRSRTMSTTATTEDSKGLSASPELLPDSG
jgi:competence ComEA-like helix-hairpin-helix protein